MPFRLRYCSYLVDDKMGISFGIAPLLYILWILASSIVFFTNKQRKAIEDYP